MNSVLKGQFFKGPYGHFPIISLQNSMVKKMEPQQDCVITKSGL